MAKIFEENNCIIFENDYASITVSKNTALCIRIIDKTSGKDIKAEKDVPFVALENKDGEQISFKSLSLSSDIMTAEFENGSFDIRVSALDSYFTFELLTSLPDGVFFATVARLKYEYDPSDRASVGAVGIAMTVSANPMFYPNGYSKETYFTVYPHLEDKGAKYGLVIAPFDRHGDIIKELCSNIDRDKGLFTPNGGAFTRDSEICFTNYMIEYSAETEFVRSNIEYYKTLGVDQIDFHKGTSSFRQGDFKFMKHKDSADFKEQIVKLLEENGMSAGLHTYSCYIEYDASEILTRSEYQKQLKVFKSFTLAEDITAEALFIPSVEVTDGDGVYDGLDLSNETPFILIDEEIIKISKSKDGFNVVARGHADTKTASHKKGSVIKYLEGHYCGFCPELGSELYLQVARNTARAYNEGGFKMIYLDALDGVCHHCSLKHEYWYYTALFIREVLKYCDTPPILESAAYATSLWGARGRIYAWDVCRRGYKNYSIYHSNSNQTFVNSHLAPTMGWYDYYPTCESAPGNEHVKYEHADTVEQFGSISLINNYSTVFNDISRQKLDRYRGLRRNIAIYKKYDTLRKEHYFDNEYLKKAASSPYELHLKDKKNGYAFVEKSYRTAKLYDLSDAERGSAEFENPFGRQIPFIRIEALMSTLTNAPMMLLPIDENTEIKAQNLSVEYGNGIDLSNHLAKKVRIFGNGKGGKVAVRVTGGSKISPKYQIFVINIDFEGWREFVLIETDNGETIARDFEFVKGKDNDHLIFRSPFEHDKVTGIRVEYDGDVDGVRMSPITACEHTYEVLKNPTVTIGKQSIMFECELMSSDFIEFDGETAKVIDRYGNEKTVWFTSDLKAPNGKFKASLTARALNRGIPRAQLTLGFTGKEI